MIEIPFDMSFKIGEDLREHPNDREAFLEGIAFLKKNKNR